MHRDTIPRNERPEGTEVDGERSAEDAFEDTAAFRTSFLKALVFENGENLPGESKRDPTGCLRRYRERIPSSIRLAWNVATSMVPATVMVLVVRFLLELIVFSWFLPFRCPRFLSPPPPLFEPVNPGNGRSAVCFRQL